MCAGANGMTVIDGGVTIKLYYCLHIYRERARSGQFSPCYGIDVAETQRKSPRRGVSIFAQWPSLRFKFQRIEDPTFAPIIH
jgi:hypothetical protein